LSKVEREFEADFLGLLDGEYVDVCDLYVGGTSGGVEEIEGGGDGEDWAE
jgi:hypothetical protein